MQGEPFSVYGAEFFNTLRLIKDTQKRRKFEEQLVEFFYDVSFQLNSEGYGDIKNDWTGTKEEFIHAILDSQFDKVL